MANNTVITLIASSPVWTSELIVQGMQRLNVSIRMGSVGISEASIALSTFSGLVTLQRQFHDDDAGVWRDVQQWAVSAADALAGGTENISANVEPETVTYRLGVKTGDYYGVGAANVRLGAG